MKVRAIFFLFVFGLTACTPTQSVDIQGMAVALAVTEISITQATPLMTTPLPPTSGPTATIEYILPTPYPTQPPIHILTPDAIQTERWQEYQTELAKVVLSSNQELGSGPAIYKDALCEWDILGQSEQEVYVYAVCVIAKDNGDMRTPAIIYLESDGSIQKVKLPEPKEANSEMFDYDPFPIYVQEKFCYYFDPFPSDLPPCPYDTYPRPRLEILYTHIEYRKRIWMSRLWLSFLQHLRHKTMKTNIIFLLLLALALTACTSTPPVDIQGTAVALAKTGVALTQTAQPTATLPPTVMPTAIVVYPTPSPYPTQKPLPIFTPDAIQVERWKEYQRELAKLVLSQAGDVFPYYELAICEWDILDQTEQKVYVWAECSGAGTFEGRPAVIYLEKNGAIRDIDTAFPGSTWDARIQELFPTNVQGKFELYIGQSIFDGRVREMSDHLIYRETHPEIPPLVVLSATPTP